MIGEICVLLEQKKDRFAEYEQATQALLDCPPDDAEHYITRRSELATVIDGLDEQLHQLCGQAPDAAELWACTRANLPFERVPSAYQPVYYTAQGVQSIIQRIIQTEQQAKERLERLRQEALDAIKQNQNVPKIKKYLTGLTDVPVQPLTESKA